MVIDGVVDKGEFASRVTGVGHAVGDIVVQGTEDKSRVTHVLHARHLQQVMAQGVTIVRVLGREFDVQYLFDVVSIIGLENEQTVLV